MKYRTSSYLDIDIEKLKELYVGKNVTLEYLAKNVFYCSRPTLSNRLKEAGLPIRANGQKTVTKYKPRIKKNQENNQYE